MIRHSRLPTCALAALVFATIGCSSSSTPQTADEAVTHLLSALADGDQSKLAALMLNKDDIEDLITNAGSELTEDKAKSARAGIQKNAERLREAWQDLNGGAKDAGVDFAQLKVASVRTDSETKRGTTQVTIVSQLSDGQRQHELSFRTLKTSRGLALSSRPRISWAFPDGATGVVDRLVGHRRALLALVEQHKDDGEAAEDAVETYLTNNEVALSRAKKAMDDALRQAQKSVDPDALARLRKVGAKKMSALVKQQSALEANIEIRGALQKVEQALY